MTVCLSVCFPALFGVCAHAEDAQISARKASERLDFSDGEIAEGFVKVAFGAELQFGGGKDRIRKFEGPVRVFIDRHGGPNRAAELAAVAADIKAHVPDLDLAVTGDKDAANVIVTTVRAQDLDRTLARRFGTKKAKQIKRSLTPVCLSGIGKDETYRIQRAEVYLPSNASDFTFYDCAYEELLQALGPINDTASVPWTMFNDKTQMGFFDRFDQYLLNILYDPRILPGMTKAEVTQILPEVIASVRTKVAAANANAPLRQSSNADPSTAQPD